MRLADAGWSIVARNVRIGRSELDLIAVDPGPPVTLVVVEVRANRSSAFGRPEERVDRGKLRSVYRGAVELRKLGRVPDGPAVPHLPIRVDLVAVEDGPRLGRHAGGPILRHARGLIG